MKNILVTGGAGFIGSNFVPYFLEKYPNYRVINLDLLTYAGNLKNLSEISTHENYKFIKGDISNRELVEHIFAEYRIDGVIHFAAESHVDNSISSPEAFVKTNVNGTFTLLDVARKTWLDAPFKYKLEFASSRFLHVSTDEVYGSLGDTGYFTETTPYAPNSPYSASKAASDLIVRSYFHTYGFQVVTTNCSNNYGPKQHDEKLIPTIIRKAVAQQSIPIYGDGKNVRDWLFVLDHCTGIDAAFHRGSFGETYNIGSRNEQNNLAIVHTICGLLDEIVPLESGRTYNSLITFVADRPGHDRRYAIDSTKIENELTWKAETNFEEGLRQTILWYLDKHGVKLNEPQAEKIVYANVQPKAAEKQAEVKQESPKQAASEPSKAQFEQTFSNFNAQNYKETSTDFEIGVYEPDYDALNANDLSKALEGLAEIKAATNLIRKNIENLQAENGQRDKKAAQLMQAAQSGLMDWTEANRLALALLGEQNEIKKVLDARKKELADFLRLEEKMQQNIVKIRAALHTQRISPKIPDSSATISMIERMKQKIEKNEILGDLYAAEVKKQEQDAELGKKVDKALGIDAQKESLDELKRKIGIKPEDKK